MDSVVKNFAYSSRCYFVLFLDITKYRAVIEVKEPPVRTSYRTQHSMDSITELPEREANISDSNSVQPPYCTEPDVGHINNALLQSDEQTK